MRFRDPVILPKTIPLHTIEAFLSIIYRQCHHAKTAYQKRNALRDAAVIELLFATGMRISELCALKNNDVNLFDGTILIYGKGDKERLIQIGNAAVIHILEEYKNNYHSEIQNCNHFFTNQSGNAWTQLYKYYTNIYTCSCCKTKRHFNYETSAKRYASMILC